MKYLPSILALIAANLIPLAGAIFFRWDAFSILVLYWLESAVVGFYNVFKMQRASVPPTEAETGELRGYLSGNTSAAGLTGKALTRFFILHYGGFMLGHAIFLAAFIFGFSFSKWYMLPELTPEFFLTVFISLAALFASHGYSYKANFIGKQEFTRISPERQMTQPYRRIVVMHLAIVFGAIFLFMLRSPLALLITMIIAKILLDIYYHLKEHNALSPKWLTPPYGSASAFSVKRPRV